MKHGFSGLLLMLASSLAFAASPVHAPGEWSMPLTGGIVIAPDGTVQSHTLDHPEKLTGTIATAVDKAVSAWRFTPVQVDGKPVAATTRMSLRLVATPHGAGQAAVRIKGVLFGADKVSGGGVVSTPQAKRVVPGYPPDAARAGIGATVYLVLKVGADGKVLDAVAQQVNLAKPGSADEMAHWRQAFSRAALAAATRWTYEVPTTGRHAGQSPWTVHISVDYFLPAVSVEPRSRYGQWQAYMPGPVEPVSWGGGSSSAAGNADSLAPGAMLTIDKDIHLLGAASGK